MHLVQCIEEEDLYNSLSAMGRTPEHEFLKNKEKLLQRTMKEGEANIIKNK